MAVTDLSVLLLLANKICWLCQDSHCRVRDCQAVRKTPDMNASVCMQMTATSTANVALLESVSLSTGLIMVKGWRVA